MGARELGNPLGNALALRRKAGGGLEIVTPAIIDFVNGESGDFTLPEGFSFFRITVVGGGATSTSDATSAGGGGGLSRTAILPFRKNLIVSYVAGIGGVRSGGGILEDGGTSTAKFDTTLLTATGGNSRGPGGVGSGGQDNYSGGIGAARSSAGTGGGGAAGFGDNGGAGGTNGANGSPSLTGGGGGAGGANTLGGAGGGGVFAPGGKRFQSFASVTTTGGTRAPYWGAPGDDAPLGNSAANAGSGGNWGGGAGSTAPGTVNTTPVGGYGGVRIELW